MPELPEVETVRCGLAPAMVGAEFAQVTLRRRDLRFPLPRGFASRLTGATVETLRRRGKYLVADLSTDESLIMHLGMSGRFRVEEGGGGPAPREIGRFVSNTRAGEKHDHVAFDMRGRGHAHIVYHDPRRFGFMDLAKTAEIEECRHFKGMGPEPLGDLFSAEALSDALRGRRTPIKTALLDQRVVAGLGNIYVCEALFRAGVSPKRLAASVPGVRAARIYEATVAVLKEAIAAGGSSLKDFAAADGALGYFQHGFDVYDRQGEPCRTCKAPLRRLVQAGRSTFYCSRCQR